ncbi:MAG: site-2 protease family protein [Gemmatimonadetes bacterium]|nr:site-2 protease family protein [Gemmatimonadota bacterium]
MVQVHDQQVFQARLLPGLSLQDAAVRPWVEQWPGRVYSQPGPDGLEVTLARRIRPRPRERWWLHLLLLALTLLTATVAGATLVEGDPLRIRDANLGAIAIPVPTRLTPLSVAPGLWFSLPLLVILGAHELGHYALARRHGMDVSPPYFIPAPWMVSLIGTFGAFIRLRSPLLNRAVLLDVGAAGPIASFLLSIPAVLLGLAWSATVTDVPAWVGGARTAVLVDGQTQLMGESVAFILLRSLSPVADAPFVVLHPLAFAGWLGFFFTALNLFPVSQLDGGHVVFALSRRAHRVVGVLTVALLLALSFGWKGWLVWAVLVMAIGRGRLGHPPVFDPAFRLGPARRAAAWACIVIFFLTLVPVPFPV